MRAITPSRSALATVLLAALLAGLLPTLSFEGAQLTFPHLRFVSLPLNELLELFGSSPTRSASV